ncbi:hypothetical protein FRC07_010717, partial [Ceratobasidium sp. 392]
AYPLDLRLATIRTQSLAQPLAHPPLSTIRHTQTTSSTTRQPRHPQKIPILIHPRARVNSRSRAM